MRESQFNRKVIKLVQQRIPQAVIWKLADRFTKGIPDTVIIFGELSTWFEFKNEDEPLSAMQKYNLSKIVRGFVVRRVAENAYQIHKGSNEVPILKYKTYASLAASIARLAQSNWNYYMLKD